MAGVPAQLPSGQNAPACVAAGGSPPASGEGGAASRAIHTTPPCFLKPTSAAVAELSHVPQLQIVLRNRAGRRLLAGRVLEVPWEVVLQRLVQESVVRAEVVQKPAEGPAQGGRAYPSTVGGVCLRSGVVADRVVFVQHAGKNAGIAEVSRDGRGGGRPVWLLVFRV